MTYYIRIDGTNYPVAPEEYTDERGNKNTPATLVNEDEINIIKKPGLKVVSMDIRLPREQYSWAYWEQPQSAALPSGFNEPEDFIEVLNGLKTEKKVFELMIIKDEEGKNFTMDATLEDFSITENNEFVTATCSFKEYADYTTKIVGSKITTTASKTLKPKKTSYTVAKGDTLQKISKKMYGVQKYSSKIYSWNKNAIEKAAKKHGKKSSSNGKHIYKGTKLTLKKITK